MTEQTTAPRDEGHQPGTDAGTQLSGEPSPADYVTSPTAGPEHLDGSPQQVAAPEQSADGQAADITGLGTSSTRSRRRKAIVIAAAAAVVVIASGVALGVTLSSGGSGQSLPSTLLGLARDDSSDAQQATGQITSGLGVLQGLIVHPQAAIYGTPDDGLLILTGQFSAAAKTDGLVPGSSTAAMGGLRSQGVTDAALFPAGPHGGSLACGDKTLEGQSGVVCAWADGSMFGVAIYLGSASDLGDAAAKTVQVRSAVEH